MSLNILFKSFYCMVFKTEFLGTVKEMVFFYLFNDQSSRALISKWWYMYSRGYMLVCQRVCEKLSGTAKKQVK